MKSNLRFDERRWQAKVDKLKKLESLEFKPDLIEFGRKSLSTASRTTPLREANLIRENQRRQYEFRVNFIPSAHKLEDPSLRVSEGVHWIFSGGKWYRGDWQLPERVWSQYQTLLSERNRRLKLSRTPFIKDRLQARYLYRRSWWQVAESIGAGFPPSSGMARAVSRHNPRVDPPKSYGQWRGGKATLSVVVFNKLLETPSRYISFSAQNIFNAAVRRHRPSFIRAVEKRMKGSMAKSFK